jgi:hypothetical protein
MQSDFKHKLANSGLSQVSDDPDSSRRPRKMLGTSRDLTDEEEEMERVYYAHLQKAKTLNLDDIKELNILYHSGNTLSRSVI